MGARGRIFSRKKEVAQEAKRVEALNRPLVLAFMSASHHAVFVTFYAPNPLFEILPYTEKEPEKIA